MSFGRNLPPGAGWLIGIWLFFVTLGLTFWGGVIYVAWHFISKYW